MFLHSTERPGVRTFSDDRLLCMPAVRRGVTIWSPGVQASQTIPVGDVVVVFGSNGTCRPPPLPPSLFVCASRGKEKSGSNLQCSPAKSAISHLPPFTELSGNFHSATCIYRLMSCVKAQFRNLGFPADCHCCLAYLHAQLYRDFGFFPRAVLRMPQK